MVVSRTLDKVAWKTARIVRDLEEIRKMKQQPGKDMQVVGGATLVSSLMNLGLSVTLKDLTPTPEAVTVGEIALLYTDFQGTTVDASGTTVEIRHKALEVLRRQPDGTWKLIVGDPNGREGEGG
jgi:hypothetical protein